MANFGLIYPSGPPFKGVFRSSDMGLIDARWPKISNWQNGSDHTLDSGASVTLGGDNTTFIRFDLTVGITYLLSIAPDAALNVNGTSGHPGGLVLKQYSETIWEFGSTAEFQSGAQATWQSGSALVVASGVTFQVSTEQDIQSGGKVRIKSGATLQVDSGGASTNASALGVQLTGSAPAKNADPGANNIAIGLNQIKAMGSLTSDGAGGVDCADGMNVSGVVIFGANGWTVTFARPMANATYAVVATFVAIASTTYIPMPVVQDKSTSGFTVILVKPESGYPGADVANDQLGVDFVVTGRQ